MAEGFFCVFWGERGKGTGAISMLEIASTRGLLDHDTSQAVLIIWTAPSAPLIFYPRQFIQSSACVFAHTVHFTAEEEEVAGEGAGAGGSKSSLLGPTVAGCFCMACSDDSEAE